MLDDDRVPPKGGRAAAEAARADYLAAVRLRHVLHAIGASRHGEVTSHVKGDETRGVCLSSDGNAEHHVVAWSPEGILAIAYDDDASPLYLDRDCEDVQAVLADIPERLKPLIADVAKPRMGLPVTSAKWIEVTDEGTRGLRARRRPCREPATGRRGRRSGRLAARLPAVPANASPASACNP